MNMLIIGNGFDLAHNLPTKYQDFLDFVITANHLASYNKTLDDFIFQYEKEERDVYFRLNKYVKDYLLSFFEDDSTPKKSLKFLTDSQDTAINEYIRYTNDNFWIKWFSDSDSYIDEGWIDFEAEISRVVQSYEIIMYNWDKGLIERKELSSYDEKLLKFIFPKLIFPGNDYISISSIPKSEYVNFHSKLKSDLNNLILCLELYLVDCVGKINKTVLSPDIYSLSINYVLSFNYTDTFEKLYGQTNRSVKYDFIHGKARTNREYNNMVLGIDEYLEGDERNKNIYNIEFKKFFQRIHKKTGCEYKTWLEKIDDSKEKHHVYVFGHSLAITDGDILRDILLNEKICTTIYYYDSKQYGQQISNLVQVLGQDTLINMVYGSTPKIQFVKQSNMIDKMHSEWQIRNDIIALSNISMLHDSEIQVFTSRIEENLTTQNLEYFYSQIDVIDLYNVVVNNKIFNNESVYYKKFYNIAIQLYSAKGSTQYDPNGWVEYDHVRHTMEPCHHKVEEFIEAINTYNMKNDNPINSDATNLPSDINELINQLTKMLTVSDIQFEKIFYNFFERFNCDNEDMSLIWKGISKLGKKYDNDKWRKFIKNKLSTSEGIEKIRFSHIQEMIYEDEYSEQLIQEAQYFEESLEY